MNATCYVCASVNSNILKHSYFQSKLSFSHSTYTPHHAQWLNRSAIICADLFRAAAESLQGSAGTSFQDNWKGSGFSCCFLVFRPPRDICSAAHQQHNICTADSQTEGSCFCMPTDSHSSCLFFRGRGSLRGNDCTSVGG